MPILGTLAASIGIFDKILNKGPVINLEGEKPF